jgi:hypothetical protein
MITKRPFRVALVVGLLVALFMVGATMALIAISPTNYRAEAQVALLPARDTPPAELSSSWEALSRGQSSRIAAQVLGQRRWLSAAARAAGAPPSSLQLTAGAVADTTVISIDVVAPTPQGAEKAVNAVIVEARPLIEDVAGKISVEIIQPPEGSATPVGTPAPQLLTVTGIAGLLIGAGATLLVHRRISSRRGGRDSGFTPTPVYPLSVDRVSLGEHEDDANHAGGGSSDPSAVVGAVNGTKVEDALAGESASVPVSDKRHSGQGGTRWRPSPVKRSSAPAGVYDPTRSELADVPPTAVDTGAEPGADVALADASASQLQSAGPLETTRRRPLAVTPNGSQAWPPSPTPR